MARDVNANANVLVKPGIYPSNRAELTGFHPVGKLINSIVRLPASCMHL